MVVPPSLEASSLEDQSDLEPGYAVRADDNITLLASKVMRDVLVTRDEPVRRRELWQAVELAMGDRSPDVDGVLKGTWFNNPVYGKWVLTEAAEAAGSPFVDAHGIINVANVVDYLRRCSGEAPYIGDVGDFIKLCRPTVHLGSDWLTEFTGAITRA